jgi:hypothetical protein
LLSLLKYYIITTSPRLFEASRSYDLRRRATVI